MRYRLAPRAVADLEEITDYVAAENPQAARWLLVAIERRFEQLASQPWSGWRAMTSRPASGIWSPAGISRFIA